jgi:hypothetical protein
MVSSTYRLRRSILGSHVIRGRGLGDGWKVTVTAGWGVRLVGLVQGGIRGIKRDTKKEEKRVKTLSRVE